MDVRNHQVSTRGVVDALATRANWQEDLGHVLEELSGALEQVDQAECGIDAIKAAKSLFYGCCDELNNAERSIQHAVEGWCSSVGALVSHLNRQILDGAYSNQKKQSTFAFLTKKTAPNYSSHQDPVCKHMNCIVLSLNTLVNSEPIQVFAEIKNEDLKKKFQDGFIDTLRRVNVIEKIVRMECANGVVSREKLVEEKEIADESIKKCQSDFSEITKDINELEPIRTFFEAYSRCSNKRHQKKY